jgi:hypothetical protein
MPPSSNTPGSEPARYDFFMGETQQPKVKVRLPGGFSLGRRLLVIIGGLVVLTILIVIVSFLFGGSSNFTSFIAVAQDQNELVRVATEATGQTTEQPTQNLATSVQLSLTSAQQQLLTYLNTNGHTVSTKQLTATKDLKTDQQLTAAEAASTFDTVFSQVIVTNLQSYTQDLKTALSTAGPKGAALLKSDLTGAQLLLSQAQSVASSLSSQ